jgi:superfamily II DNA or RNA helicase
MSNPLVFSDADQLRLLQLMTRKAIASRQAASMADHSEGDQDDDAARPPSQAPAKWRLTATDLKLHPWQQECLPIWMKLGRGTVKVATGGGKTIFALAAAQALQNGGAPDLRLVIVVPTIPLMLQWYDEVRSGNLPESAIGLMGGGRELVASPDLRILICVLNSARERLAGVLKHLNWPEAMSMMVVDECHRANAEQAQKIFQSKVRFTLGLSATPEQDAETEGLSPDEVYNQGAVGRALGPIIYDYTLKRSADDGLLTPFEVWHVSLPLDAEEEAQHARLSRDISELRRDLQREHQRSRSTASFLAWCQQQASRNNREDARRFVGLANERKRLLYRARARIVVTLNILAEAAEDPLRRTIVFHESIKEIEDLYLHALGRGLPAVLEHSKLGDALRAESIDGFRRGTARIIISAKSLVEGFNVPSADLGVIAASAGSVRQRIQSLGRLLRRKAGGQTARVIVLYIRETEDEAIYEKADWEGIIGAGRNRYFHWRPSESGKDWGGALENASDPPRAYRPPSSEVDTSALAFGAPYPGQTTGLFLKLDQAGNLRADDGGLTNASGSQIEAIVVRNQARRAVRTPAGHLIVRGDGASHGRDEWFFLGDLDAPAQPNAGTIRLRIKSASGRRVIAMTRGKDREYFALSKDTGASSAGDEARGRLLRWIERSEKERRVVIRELCWDGACAYWLELGGERLPCPEAISPLEFRE